MRHALTRSRFFTIAVITGVAVASYFAGQLGDASARAGQIGQSPTAANVGREAYYPGTEALDPDEMRISACGTGMPNARPKQAAACWLLELGNGDKFLFDIGLGSAERIAAFMIPYDFLDKLFIGHLHADHIGDLDALWIGGVLPRVQRLRHAAPDRQRSPFHCRPGDQLCQLRETTPRRGVA